jgi:hypothetical protein
VDALAGGHADHFLAELPEQHTLAGQLGVLGGESDDVAPSGLGIEAEQQVRGREMEKMQRMRLQHLAVVHQPADLLGGRRQHGANHLVEGLAGGEVVADRADAAQPLHHHRHFPVRPALDELLEAPELDDVQSRLLDDARLVQQQGDLAVALDPGEGFDDDALEAGATRRFQRVGVCEGFSHS